jgi:hypothetical protein
MSSRPSLAPRPPSSIWLIEPESEMSRIPYTKPSITEWEVAYATDAARNDPPFSKGGGIAHSSKIFVGNPLSSRLCPRKRAPWIN